MNNNFRTLSFYFNLILILILIGIVVHLIKKRRAGNIQIQRQKPTLAQKINPSAQNSKSCSFLPQS
jgi:hypothetical protein